MLIDVHAHYMPRKYAELTARIAARPPFAGGSSANHRPDAYQPRTDDPADIEGRVRLMDEAGVHMQILSHSVNSPYAPSESDAVEAARLCNDSYNDLVKQHPDRFASFAALPLPHAGAALREMQRALDDLGMVGVAMNCSCLNQPVVDHDLDPLYEEMNRRGSVLYFHPSGNGMCSPLLTEQRLNFALGAPMEDTQLVGHLIVKQIPHRFPNIKIIVSHFGGATPVLLHRMDNEMPYSDLPEAPSVTARRLYYDTVGHGSQAALLSGWKAFGADHLLAGSDYPVLLAFEDYRQTFDYIRDSDLPPEDVDKILNRNAPRLLGYRS